jgi:hypothetical protein
VALQEAKKNHSSRASSQITEFLVVNDVKCEQVFSAQRPPCSEIYSERGEKYSEKCHTAARFAGFLLLWAVSPVAIPLTATRKNNVILLVQAVS